MKLPASDKISSYGKKPHVKKGYYPGQLLKVSPYADSEGNLKEGKYGRQLIFEFAIYKADANTGAPIEPMKYQAKEDSNELVPIIIPKFVYHEYKNRKTGEFQTAITPNSAITKILKALGWVFSAEGVELDQLIGKWVEVNLDDYEQKFDDEIYIASTIKDINPYKGPEPKDIETVEPVDFTSKKIKKQVKHKVVKEKISPNQKEIDRLKSKIEELKKLNKDGFLTNEGLKQATEQIETQIKELE